MTAPYYTDDTVTVWHGDCLDVMATMPDNSVDAVITDPPYGLEFMGKEWDRFSGSITDRDFKGFVLSQQRTRNVKCPECGRWAYDHPGRLCECGGIRRAQGSTFQHWCEQWAAQALRVLKPGGHLLAFGGTRTWHRLAVAIEDAGFEIRDSIAWLYGSGFPKSLDVSKAIDKAAGATREVVGEREDFVKRRNKLPHDPNSPTGLYRWGDSYLPWNVLEPHAREFYEREHAKSGQITAPATAAARQWAGWGTALKPAFEPVVVARKPLAGTVAANVLRFGTGALNVDGCRVTPQSGDYAHPGNENRKQTTSVYGGFEREGRQAPPHAAGRWPTNVVLDDTTAAELDQQTGISRDGVAVNRNREADNRTSWYGSRRSQAGEDIGYGGEGGASRFFPVFRYEPKAPTAERPRDGDTAHPTVKPLDLMRWLVRLVCPPGGLVLDPFAGTGTTGEACVIEGFRCIAIEREPAYLPLIVARLSKPIQPDLFGGGVA